MRKTLEVFKVECKCGRVRYWDDLQDVNDTCCPECAGKYITVTKVEVQQ
jgi:hypothetical protein